MKLWFVAVRLKDKTGLVTDSPAANKLKATIARMEMSARIMSNIRAEWCRAKDARTPHKPQSRHPLQHDSSAPSSYYLNLRVLRILLAVS